MDRWSGLADSALVESVGRGDREAFGEIVRRHQRAVLSIAYRFLADRSEAEDAAQEVFLRLWAAAARYRPEAGLGAYLRVLTVNHCLDLKRKLRPLVLVPQQERTGDADPHGDLEAAERKRALERALQALPASQRMAVVLFHMEGLSLKEAAAALDLSPKATESLLSRARTSLREKLGALLGP